MITIDKIYVATARALATYSSGHTDERVTLNKRSGAVVQWGRNDHPAKAVYRSAKMLLRSAKILLRSP